MNQDEFTALIDQLIAGGQRELALSKVRALVEEGEDNPAILYFAGHLYRRFREFETAVECFLQAISIEPLFLRLHVDYFSFALNWPQDEGKKILYQMWENAIGPADPVSMEDTLIAQALETSTHTQYVIASILSRLHFEVGNVRRAFELFHKVTKDVSLEEAKTLEHYDPTEYEHDDYDTTDMHHHTVQQFTPFFQQMMGEARDKEILDLACGSGLAAGVLKPYARRLVGLDFSRKMLELAGQTEKYDNLLYGDMSAMPSDEARVDVVFCLGATYYLPDIEPFLRAAIARLVPGGYLIFSDYLARQGSALSVTTGGNQRFCRGEAYMRSMFDELGLVEIGFSACLVYGLPSGCWAVRKD